MRPARWWTIAATIAAAAALCASPPCARAQQAEPPPLPNEYTVKAVFLYNFGRYVEWPGAALGNPADPLVIGILGEDSFAGALDEIAAKKTIQGRRIVIRRFASLEEYRPPCQILFVSRSLKGDLQAAAIKKTAGTGVLLVGETPGFAELGGIANFFVDGDRIRFEINASAARRAQLRMDAKLLSLGRPVGVQ
ncbi:MAG: YfiR family protein [Thermoguttaceae bacterium]